MKSRPIFPCLWFENQAKEAAHYYCSIFSSSEIVSANDMVVIFRLNETKFMALNGRATFQFNESLSFVVECETQEEIDHYWQALSKEGQEGMCGWLKDRYGVSWQIVPTILSSLMSDSTRADRVVQAFLKMRKFDISALLNA